MRQTSTFRLLAGMGATALLALAAYSKQRPQAMPSAQPSRFQPLRANAEDISEEQALMQSRSLIATLGLAMHDNQTQSRLYYDALFMRTREVHMGSDYTMRFDSTDGQLVYLKNERREQEQLKGIYRNKPHLVQTRPQAEQLLWRLARKIGLPANAAMTTFRWFGDNDPQHADANKAGTIVGGFTIPLPGRHPVNFWAPEPGMTLTVDPVDGTLVELRQEWRIKPINTITSITATQAVAQATAGVNRYIANTPRVSAFFNAGHAQPVSNTKLEYVAPNEFRLVNGRMITVPKQITYPKTLRLAWVVRFGRSEIWIDAGNGQQLGIIEGEFK